MAKVSRPANEGGKSGMRTKSVAGFRPPASGPTETAGPGTTRLVDAPDEDTDEDITGQAYEALDVLEATYDTCRRQAEASLRKVSRKR